MLRTHCQTSGVSLTEQDPYNNVVRTAFEAMSAVLGGTQSLHTNAFDEAMALPTDFSARIARNTQLILQHETGVTKVVDPLGGSYYVEKLTKDLADKAWELIAGGRGAGRHDQGRRPRAAEAAHRGGGRAPPGAIDKGEEVIVGVNKYRLAEEPRSTSSTSTTSRCARARSRGWRRCAHRATRRPARARWPRSRKSRPRRPARATCWRRRRGRPRARHGGRDFRRDGARCSAATGPRSPDAFPASMARPMRATRNSPRSSAHRRGFAEAEGRRPHMLVVKMGQDGHDRGAKVIATAFADMGFDVDLSAPCSRRPKRPRRTPIDNDVHVVGVSSPGRRPQDAGAEADRPR
jgi:methylmalonyl-CoA mutase